MILTNYIIKARKTKIFGEVIKNEGVRKMREDVEIRVVISNLDELEAAVEKVNEVKSSKLSTSHVKVVIEVTPLMKENNF